jgi:transposase
MVLGGRTTVRTALYLPPLTAIRRTPARQAFYQRLLGRGRPAQGAITACLCKLLVILDAILRDHRPWQTA